MKRMILIVAVVAIGATLLGVLVVAWAIPPWASKTQSMRDAPAVATDATAPSGATGETGNAPKGVINMPPEQIAAQEIEVAPVKEDVFSRVLTVPGVITLDTDLVARVPARVVGTVSEMRKRLGDSVVKGEVVAILDSREVADAKSECLTASVAFDLKKTLYERAQTLWAKRISAEQQYLQAREAFLQAELRLDLARQKLSALHLDATEVVKAAKQESGAGAGVSSLREYPIRSLIGGRVIDRKVDVGSLVGSQGDPSDLYTIADVSTVWVELSVPMADLQTVEEGQTVEIASGGVNGNRGEGQIKFISPLVHPDTRSARVIAEIDNRTMVWRPGTVVAASIVIKSEPVAVRVPRAAIQTMGGERVVFVRTQDGFQKRPVTTGRSDEHAVEITSGLSAGEEIAIKNTFLLKAELGKREAVEGE